MTQFATATDVNKQLDWLRSQLKAAWDKIEELLRQNVRLKQENASLRDEVTGYRKSNGGSDA